LVGGEVHLFQWTAFYYYLKIVGLAKNGLCGEFELKDKN
jgi:hypothetical protein